jgi:enoyl-CoA hydratase/carnithine racemase
MSSLLVELQGRVAVLTLNRPEALNALDPTLGQALAHEIQRGAEDPGVGAIVITGAGRAFCSGGDIAFMKSVFDKGGRYEDFEPLVGGGPGVVRAIESCAKPVIAAVNGAAAGGGMSLALVCDVRWASEKARFGQSFVKIGSCPRADVDRRPRRRRGSPADRPRDARAPRGRSPPENHRFRGPIGRRTRGRAGRNQAVRTRFPRLYSQPGSGP